MFFQPASPRRILPVIAAVKIGTAIYAASTIMVNALGDAEYNACIGDIGILYGSRRFIRFVPIMRLSAMATIPNRDIYTV